MTLFVEEVIDYLIQVFSSIVGMMMCCNAILKRGRSMTMFVVYTVIKILVVNVYFLKYSLEYLGKEGVTRSVYTGFLILTALLTYVVLLNLYEDDFAKIAIVTTATEMFTIVIGYAAKAIPAFFVGERLYEEIPRLTASDFITPLLAIAINFALLRIFRKTVLKLRNWEVKHKRIIMAVFVSYLSLSVYTMNSTLAEEAKIISSLVAVIFAYIMVRYINYYYRKMLWEKELLSKSWSLVEMQYKGMLLQTEKIVGMQKEINAKVERILEISSLAENKTEQIERYISSLKEQADSITIGVFCDDRHLDAAFFYASKACSEKKIEYSFNVQGYKSDSVKTPKLAEYMYKTLDNAVTKTKEKLTVDVTTVKGKTLIRIASDGKVKTVLWGE